MSSSTPVSTSDFGPPFSSTLPTESVLTFLVSRGNGAASIVQIGLSVIWIWAVANTKPFRTARQ